MNKLYLGLMFFLFAFIGITTAATDTSQVSDVFQLNHIVDYGKPCFNNGTYCSATTECNFTFTRPDNSIQIGNGLATNQLYIYNYTISFDSSGIYKIDMTCDDNGLKGSETFYAQVTPSGINNNVSFLVIYLLICVAIIGLAFIVLEPWFAIFGSILLIPAGLYIINNGIGDMKDMTTTWAIGIVIIGVATVIAIKSGLELMEE